MATREEALQLLESAEIENGDTGTPLDRAEITRRVIESIQEAVEIPFRDITWRTPMDGVEDEWEFIDEHLGLAFGTSFAWSEAVPETVGGLVREVERQYRHLWKRVVVDFEENPRHCGVQSVFYGVRTIARALGDDANARWRPGDTLHKVLPDSKLIPFYRQVYGEFGVLLPLEWKVLGIFPHTFTWWALWLLISVTLLAIGFTGFFLTGLIALATFLLHVILGAISRYALPNHLSTLGDIARYIVTEQVGVRDRLKKVAGIAPPDSGESHGD